MLNYHFGNGVGKKIFFSTAEITREKDGIDLSACCASFFFFFFF